MLKHIITVTFLGSPPSWETVFDVFTMVKLNETSKGVETRPRLITVRNVVAT